MKSNPNPHQATFFGRPISAAEEFCRILGCAVGSLPLALIAEELRRADDSGDSLLPWLLLFPGMVIGFHLGSFLGGLFARSCLDPWIKPRPARPRRSWVTGLARFANVVTFLLPASLVAAYLIRCSVGGGGEAWLGYGCALAAVLLGIGLAWLRHAYPRNPSAYCGQLFLAVAMVGLGGIVLRNLLLKPGYGPDSLRVGVACIGLGLGALSLWAVFWGDPPPP